MQQKLPDVHTHEFINRVPNTCFDAVYHAGQWALQPARLGPQPIVTTAALATCVTAVRLDQAKFRCPPGWSSTYATPRIADRRQMHWQLAELKENMHSCLHCAFFLPPGDYHEWLTCVYCMPTMIRTFVLQPGLGDESTTPSSAICMGEMGSRCMLPLSMSSWT